MSTWKALHDNLLRSLDLPILRRRFQLLRRECDLLAPFADAHTLLGFLYDREQDLDVKDDIYAALVRRAQTDSEDRPQELALTLILLGLWPALNRCFRRHAGGYVGGGECLAADLGEALLLAVHRADLSRIERVAATLTRNARRYLVGRDRRQRRGARLCVPGGVPEERPETPPDTSRLGVPPGIAPSQAVALISERLAGALGDDADLLMRVIVCRQPRDELAEELGISIDAMHKRYQRALARARAFLATE